jgi:hypothetical protein
MKTMTLLLLVTLGSAAGAAATDHYRCKPGSGECPAPPVPPVPPVPPAPPPAPVLPAIPAAAHAACAGKAAGTSLTYVIGKGETMSGTCKREGKGMRFDLRAYALED